MEFKSVLLAIFVQYVVPVLGAAVFTLLVWVLTLLANMFRAKAKASKLAALGERLVFFVETTVHDLEATLKPKLLEASADGVITSTEATELKDTAIARVKAMLTEKGLTELQAMLGIVAPQVDQLISGLIEKSVASLPPTTPAPAPVGIDASRLPTPKETPIAKATP